MEGSMILKATATYTPRMSTGQFIESRITPGVRASVEASGQIVVDEAKNIVHVITGRLRDSIHSAVREQDGRTVVADVIADAPYASFEEFRMGGAKGPSHAFLRPALDTARQAIREVFNSQVALRFRG